jgi:predicted transcriptional regulator
MDLRKYLDRKKMRPFEFAALCGVSRPAVSMWLHEYRTPDLTSALKIAHATKGEIPVEAWKKKSKRAA